MLHFLGFYDYTVILTYMSLVFAVSGLLLTDSGLFPQAVACLVVCGICDAFDGTVARTKKDRTEDEKAFGIQLDSLVDVVSFGVFPAVMSIHMGSGSLLSKVIAIAYSICAVIRLAFFNVQEAKRQQQEEGCRKTYRGLPVTSISIIYPLVYLLRGFLPQARVAAGLAAVMALTAFLFIPDFSVKKPDVTKLLKRK